MHLRLKSLLESLALHLEVMNRELERLTRTEQFDGSEQSRAMLARLRADYERGLQILAEAEWGNR